MVKIIFKCLRRAHLVLRGTMKAFDAWYYAWYLRFLARYRERTLRGVALLDETVKRVQRAYAEARPLTELERTTLAIHVETGGAICCGRGKVYLLNRLPAPWAQAINEWANMHLSCRPGGNTTLYANRVRELPLDRFPEKP